MTDVMDFCTRSDSAHVCGMIYQILGGGIEAVKEECIMKDGPSVVYGSKANFTEGRALV